MGINDRLRRLLAILRAFIATLFRSNDDDEGSSSPPAAPSAPYDLGVVPDDLSIRWPTPPSIEHEVDITVRDQVVERWREPKTRLRVMVDLPWLLLDADDLEVVVDEGVRIERLFIARGRKRIRIEGGRYGQIELQLPVQFDPESPRWREDWLVEDVLFDGVHVDSKDFGMVLRGRRIGILQSVVYAARDAVRLDDGHLRNEDIIVAASRLESTGSAAVRLADVDRAVVVDNQLVGSVATDDDSDRVLAARNTRSRVKLEFSNVPKHAVALSVLLALTLSACEGCAERLVPPPPQNSGPVLQEPGLMPAELRKSLRWPFPPMIQEDVELTSVTALNNPWTRSGVRLKVRAQIEQLVIAADDVEIDGGDAMYIESLIVMPGSSRIRIVGGQYGQIVLEAPTLMEPPPEWRAVDMIEDVTLEGVNVMAVRSGLSGVIIRGRRVAIIDSRVDAQFMAVHVGDTAPVLSEDVIIAGSSLYSAGEEPTVGLRDVNRLVLVANWIENPRLAALRIHGEVEWAFASRNTLVGGGVAIAPDEGDEIEHAWFWVNTMHHNAGEAVALGPDRIRRLVLAHNRVYSASVTCLWCERTPEPWLVQRNRVDSYRAPPARP